MSHRLQASSVLVASLALILTASGSQNQPQAQKPTFRTEANFVRVDAYPTLDGRPVNDLTADDFEILENGKPQKIETFEHVAVQPPGPEDLRVEPNTIAQSRQMARETRGRLFILFLDFYHVTAGSSHRIRQAIITTLDRLITADDMVGVMTPEMRPDQMTFGRKTSTIEELLTRNWNWGERFGVIANSPIDDEFRNCYPGIGPTRQCNDDDRGVADEMIERRRESETIDSLRDLVRYLRTLREERKAILTISEGWLLFTPDASLTRRLYCSVPTQQGIGADPRTGATITSVPGSTATSACEAERHRLANINDQMEFREILDEANRSNATFYPIDPRGLAVFDEQIMTPTTGRPKPGIPTGLDPGKNISRLRDRNAVLRDMANGTDGLAILNSTNLTGDMQRIVADLSSYYLLGYYSTGKLDGKFHPITVRIKRPGVQVRARRGYQALTEREVDAARMPAPTVDPAALAVSSVLSHLTARRDETPIRFNIGYGLGTVWVAGELDQNRAQTKAWESGATAHVTVTRHKDDAVIATGDAQLAASGRGLFIRLPSAGSIPAGEYGVRVDAKPVDGVGVSQQVALIIPDLNKATFAQPLLYRRGPFTGAGWQAAGDLQFRRQERIRVEVPVAVEGGKPSIRLLGRTGLPIEVPIAVNDGQISGARTIAGELSLAPLAPSDYVLEITLARDGKEEKTLCAFRIVTR